MVEFLSTEISAIVWRVRSRSRMTELGLSRGEFAKRLGYKNVAKGIRRIDALCEGDIDGTKHFLDALPRALETSAETVKLALDQTVRELELAEQQEAEARDKIWRENFCPHAIIHQLFPGQGFDPNGQPIAILDNAVRPGTAALLLGGHPIPAKALQRIIGN